MEFKIKDKVRVRKGASRWMKERDYWLEDMPDSIDGLTGYVVGDYTHLSKDESHYIIDFGLSLSIGVNPKFLVHIDEM